MTASLDPRTLDVATPEHYERNGYPHREWAWLRRNAPLFWYERDNVDPFWVVTKHADVVWLGKQPERLQNAPRLAGREYLASRPTDRPYRDWVRAMGSAVYVPVRDDERPIAMLCVYARAEDAFGAEDMRFAESVGHVL